MLLKAGSHSATGLNTISLYNFFSFFKLKPVFPIYVYYTVDVFIKKKDCKKHFKTVVIILFEL